ncbi:MAG TPA: transcription-repair coupling factor [Armatimonadota bacterium]|jgi:transcription-repair coupling factor (superfamily II helicase)
MSIKHLLQLVADSPQFKEVSAAIERGTRGVQIEGLTPSAKSAFIGALHERKDVPLLVITYNYEQAERLHEDIAALGIGNGSLVLVPPADSMVYQEMNSDSDIIGRRLSALTRLQGGTARIVIAPIAAVLQRTVPPEKLGQYRMRIDKSSELDVEECLKRLVELGYERSEMVERPGEFSRRGGIIDVFPSTEDYPVRIDLFGDEIDSICNFDVETQRSAGDRSFVEIAPAREILLEAARAENAAYTLTKLLEDAVKTLDQQAAEKLRTRVEEDIIRIRNRAYFDGIEYYFPIVYPEKTCLLDYLPSATIAILDEPHQIESHWEHLHEELLESLNHRIQRGETIALPEDHVVSFDEAASRIARHRGNVLFSLLPRPVEWLAVDEHVSISSSPMDSFSAQMDVLVEQFRTWLKNKARVVLVTTQSTRIAELLTEHELSVSPESELPKPGIYVIRADIRAGFKFSDARLMVLTDGEVFGYAKTNRPRKAFKKGMAISSLLELNEGDFVVHINHGIGRYRGLAKLTGVAGDRDYLLLEYAGTDKLYVPADQIDRIQKYIGAGEDGPTLNKLGSAEWARTTKKVKQSVKDMAKDLVALYAARQTAEGYAFGPDTPWQQEMESAFPYEETPDQLSAIQDVKADLEAPKPMDRLICGDVGYGKTEVAIRAVFKCVNEGKQAAVLCPTTVLAQQHYNTFRERLAAYPVKVDMMSRFKSRAEQKQTVEGLRVGEVDVVIGTHRLLSKDVEFRDLGLLVVDEEHRFGVGHKERLKQLRKSVDVLTLTATPIPRTLHMSLSGIRDMSLISDPPEGRTPVKTYCQPYDDEEVRDAILRELDRDGQIYYVHNRVENIEHIADHIRNLVPYAKVGVGHGQMDEDELEQVMYDFYEGKYDVLVCTTIIESGLDVPNVNTIIINNADKMGLAQLYQLRGRVGRSNRQAYAYLYYEPHRVMTEIAERRLGAIKEFTDLGSGFRVALRDLEIRGAGNLLGAEQHGQMASVGFDMYCQLLSEAISELKGEEPEQFELPPVDLPMDAFIPTNYIPTESLRLTFYKKMTAVREASDVEKLEEEIRERFGKLPRAVKNSLEILRIRLKIAGTGIAAVATDRRQVMIKFATGYKLAPDVAIRLKRKYVGNQFQPEKIIVHAPEIRILQVLNAILDEMPAAFEESKPVYQVKMF